MDFWSPCYISIAAGRIKKFKFNDILQVVFSSEISSYFNFENGWECKIDTWQFNPTVLVYLDLVNIVRYNCCLS